MNIPGEVWHRVLLATAMTGIAAVSHAQPGSADPASAPRLYTAAQATRGETVYAESCAACHGTSLTNGNAPPLIGRSFEVSWSHPLVTLDDMFFLVRTTMPPQASATVSNEDHAAVFAYLLQMNGYAAGNVPVTVGAAGLVRPPYWVDSSAAAGAVPDAPDFIAGDANARPADSGPDQSELLAAANSTDWLHYTHDYSGTRFSPLDQINAENASKLVPACIFQVGESGNFQTGPIVYAGTMYVTTPWSTMALDAATCQPKWRHTWKPLAYPGWLRNRGVAIKDGRLVRGTSDGYLLSLNAETGALLWARRVAKSEEGETFSMAPLIYDDLVLIGPAGSEANIKGWVGAFRLSDGSQVWRFNTVPRPGEPGYETWQNPEGIPVGGGGIWTSFSLDPGTGELFVPVTNPAPDLPVHLRKGDNLYTNSIVVLDVVTGELKWHRSLVPNDSHDWDLTHASPLITTTIDGARRRAVVTAGKDGFVRVIGRETEDVLYTTAVTTIENAEAPITTTPSRVCPGVLGGVEWSDVAYHPGINMLYVPAVDWCATFTAFEEARYIPGKNYLGGTVALDEKSQGWVTAIDASTGDVAWRYRSDRPMVASVTATGGNLLLTGELNGAFLALDANDGNVLYRFNTGGSMGGGIVTYSVNGTQYIAAASGTPSNFWIDQNGGAPTIVVFKLP